MNKYQVLAWDWKENGGIVGKSAAMNSLEEAADWLKYQPYVNHVVVPSNKAPALFELIQEEEEE